MSVTAPAVVQAQTRWLLLIHQLPAQPAYLRVKVGRRLTGIGAVALKNSVYVLPYGDATQEDFQWIRREIVEGGGDATVVEARLIEGLSDAEVESRFRDSKDAEYAQVIAEARELRAGYAKKRRFTESEREDLLAKIGRLEERMEAIALTDFYGASSREVAIGLVAELRTKATPPVPSQPDVGQSSPTPLVLRGRTWVTRTGIHVDRIASAWLIRRFIDRDARFKFVPAKGYVPEPGELRFDMFEAEYSHEGDHCTFETLCERFSLTVPGLRELGQVIHDIDLKESKFARPETAGVVACLNGICRNATDDEERLRQGVVLLEALLTHFEKRKEARS
jgi:hypothetical protein